MNSELKPGERVSLNVTAISNGFLVEVRKSDAGLYCDDSERSAVFYPDLESVGASLVSSLHAGIALIREFEEQPF